MKKIGIMGAGFIGQACAQLFLEAGYEVMLSNSRGKESLYSVVSNIPDCQIGNSEDAIHFGEMVLIAIPFHNYTSLPANLLANKIVLDATNYYPERDGAFPQLDRYEITTSQLLAQHLSKSYLVKVFNAILAKDIVKDAKPHGGLHRRALPVAGDNIETKKKVFDLLDQSGFDYVDAGTLAESWRFERAKPAYCIPLNAQGMQKALAEAVRDKELPHLSWHK